MVNLAVLPIHRYHFMTGRFCVRMKKPAWRLFKAITTRAEIYNVKTNRLLGGSELLTLFNDDRFLNRSRYLAVAS